MSSHLARAPEAIKQKREDAKQEAMEVLKELCGALPCDPLGGFRSELAPKHMPCAPKAHLSSSDGHLPCPPSPHGTARRHAPQAPEPSVFSRSHVAYSTQPLEHSSAEGGRMALAARPCWAHRCAPLVPRRAEFSKKEQQ